MPYQIRLFDIIEARNKTAAVSFLLKSIKNEKINGGGIVFRRTTENIEAGLFWAIISVVGFNAAIAGSKSPNDERAYR